MKKSYWLVFIAYFIILPLHQILAETPYVVSEFIYEQNIFGRVINFQGNITNTFWINSLDQNSGVEIACGDIDGDGIDEIVTSFESGLSKIKIFSQEGKVKYDDFVPYYENYKEGMNITLGDINSDGKDEIIIVPKEGSNPINVYNYKGEKLDISFYPFSSNYHGEVKLTTGDINGDGLIEIITATGEGVRSEVRIFNNKGDLLPIQFFPFIDDFLGGINISSGDIEGDGTDEIVVCQANGGSFCKTYKYNKQKVIFNEWQTFDNEFGVVVSVDDIDRDGRGEIVVSSKDLSNQKIKVYKGKEEIINNFGLFNGSTNNVNFDVFFDSQKDKAKVTYVDDGDTIYLNDGLEVRYIGMDTPEIGEEYYSEATNRNKELLYEKEVELEYDQQKIDPYGRVLAFIYADGELVNAKLVEEGLAKVKTFPPNEKYLDLLKEKENEARGKKIGIWSIDKKESDSFSFWDLFNIFKIFF